LNRKTAEKSWSSGYVSRKAKKADAVSAGKKRKDMTAAGAKEKPGKEVKCARHPLSKNPENLSAGQEATLELIAKSNPKLFRHIF
jgi:hypothetical protein